MGTTFSDGKASARRDYAGHSPPRFEQLPHLKTIEVAEVVTAIRTRVIQLLVRRGVIEDSTRQLVLLPDDLAEQQPVLAQLTGAAVQGCRRRDRSCESASRCV